MNLLESFSDDIFNIPCELFLETQRHRDIETAKHLTVSEIPEIPERDDITLYTISFGCDVVFHDRNRIYAFNSSLFRLQRKVFSSTISPLTLNSRLKLPKRFKDS